MFEKVQSQQLANITKKGKQTNSGKAFAKVETEDAIMANIESGTADGSMVNTRLGKKLAKETVNSICRLFFF